MALDRLPDIMASIFDREYGHAVLESTDGEGTIHSLRVDVERFDLEMRDLPLRVGDNPRVRRSRPRRWCATVSASLDGNDVVQERILHRFLARRDLRVRARGGLFREQNLEETEFYVTNVHSNSDRDGSYKIEIEIISIGPLNRPDVTITLDDYNEYRDVSIGMMPAMADAIYRPFPEEYARRAGRAEHLEAASKRAEQLLLEHLEPDQVHTYRTAGYFLVRGGTTGSIYKIEKGLGASQNIWRIKPHGGMTKERICAMPSGDMPEADRLLGQKLYLEADEMNFLKKANTWPA